MSSDQKQVIVFGIIAIAMLGLFPPFEGGHECILSTRRSSSQLDWKLLALEAGILAAVFAAWFLSLSIFSPGKTNSDNSG